MSYSNTNATASSSNSNAVASSSSAGATTSTSTRRRRAMSPTDHNGMYDLPELHYDYDYPSTHLTTHLPYHGDLQNIHDLPSSSLPHLPSSSLPTHLPYDTLPNINHLPNPFHTHLLPNPFHVHTHLPHHPLPHQLPNFNQPSLGLPNTTTTTQNELSPIFAHLNAAATLAQNFVSRHSASPHSHAHAHAYAQGHAQGQELPLPHGLLEFLRELVVNLPRTDTEWPWARYVLTLLPSLPSLPFLHANYNGTCQQQTYHRSRICNLVIVSPLPSQSNPISRQNEPT
ncbi:hypothetical protein BDN72DRAFT_338071 [Pluteus cervinus]|uniref:Uncharacterized protein n=1 Tax=Pluteus cervinus TaxID=181527 RepID=A0ACD3ABQ8_9AGAR|nr:hypothetical protein BDN72DRAFT_338071 [Pluteus cervinus]